MAASNNPGDNYRFERILTHPPTFSAEDMALILDTCPVPLPTDPTTIEVVEIDNSSLTLVQRSMERPEAAREMIRRSMVDYLVAKSFELDSSGAEIQSRLKSIQDAADRLERALGVHGFPRGKHLTPPWSVAKHILRAIERSDAAHIDRISISGLPSATLDPTRARLLYALDVLGTALDDIRSLSTWTKSATRSVKSLLVPRKTSRDRSFETFVENLSEIWSEILGQDINVITGHKRNSARWAPHHDSFLGFVSFVHACLLPMGISFLKQDISTVVARLARGKSFRRHASAKLETVENTKAH